MPCNVPGTTSPGFLRLDYQHNGLRHSTRFAFIVGVDPANIPFLRTEAGRLATALAGMLPSSASVTGWDVLNPDGSHSYSEAFTPPVVGNHNTITGAPDTWSATVQVKGVADGDAPGNCVGKFGSTVHVGKGYLFAAGQQTVSTLDDPFLDDWVTAINASTYIPADKYGQQGSVRAIATVQYNAHTQRTKGT